MPENLVSRDGFSRPVPRRPAPLHTQTESGVVPLRTVRNSGGSGAPCGCTRKPGRFQPPPTDDCRGGGIGLREVPKKGGRQRDCITQLPRLKDAPSQLSIETVVRVWRTKVLGTIPVT